MDKDIFTRLRAQFPYDEVEAKIQVTTKEKTKGLAVFYLKSRAIQNRLDEAAGAQNWSNNFLSWQGNAQICGISIYDEVRSEWVTKHDGAENSDIEAIKGGLSDAFKRAAVLWGIGRYLYEIDGVWVDIEQRGNSSYIKDNQQGKLKAAYEAAVKKIFGAPANPPVSISDSKPENKEPSRKPATPVAPPPAAALAAEEAPTAATVSVTPPASPASAAPQQGASGGQKPAQQPQGGGQVPQDNVLPIHEFKVRSIKPAGKASRLLELCDHYGVLTEAYISAEIQDIAVGARLQNVRLNQKDSSFGKYNLVVGYEVAA